MPFRQKLTRPALAWDIIMPATQCPDVLAFVEGSMERIFINNNFRQVVVVGVDNGNSWTTEALCRQIITKYLAKKVFPAAIVVWFDREENADDIAVIAGAVRSAFEEAGYPGSKVHCLIPNRMSENIILADETIIKEEIEDEGYSYEFEGQNGKSKIKSLWKSVGRSYKETTDGVRLLKRIRLGRLIEGSPAVAQFLETFKSDCWWVQS
jgi:hypothetical protein